MSTGYKIIWSEEADQNVDAVLDYLENNWSEKEVSNFIIKLQECISLISKQPKLFPKSELIEGARRSVLTKQITVYYRLYSQQIEIIYVFDTRQDPNKLKS